MFPGYVDPKHNEGVLTETGWLITGDIGYLTKDERLVLTGRAMALSSQRTQYRPGGDRRRRHDFPGVQISSAVGMPDQYAGEVPILFVVPAPGREIHLRGLEVHLERNIMEPPANPSASSFWMYCQSRRSGRSSNRHCGISPSRRRPNRRSSARSARERAPRTLSTKTKN